MTRQLRALLLAKLYDGLQTIGFSVVAATLYTDDHPWLCVLAVALGIVRC